MAKESKFIPRKKYVLVLQDEVESLENEYGLSVPASTEQEEKTTGIVKAVGSEVDDIKNGNHIIYGAFAGETVITKENGKEVKMKLLYDEDIIGFIK